MRALLTIFCAGCLWLALSTTYLHAQVVPIDFSQAVEMKVVWKMGLGAEGSKLTYTKDFGGKAGFDVVTTFMSGRGGQTWSTRPKLDTTNLFNWQGSHAASLAAIDYDGIPPLEYINYFGIVWRRGMGESPFPLTPIDTVGYLLSTGEPLRAADVDGDGFLDVITDIATGGLTARIVMGGPQSGKGQERVFTIPKVYKDRTTSLTHDFYRSSTGPWRLVQVERDEGGSAPTLVIYDVLITREAGKPKATFIQRDELTEDVLHDPRVFVDTVARKDWLIVGRAVGDPLTGIAERFDVTDGLLITTGEQVTGYVFDEPKNLGYTLGTSKPVIITYGQGRVLFCYGDNLRQPFAWLSLPGLGVQPVSSYAAINDQTGDGKNDLLISGGGALCLVSLDPSVTTVEHVVNETRGASARLTGDVLEVTLDIPMSVSAQIATLDGRTSPLLALMQGTVGMNRYDLSTALRRVASGAYHLRVRVGESFLTIPILR